jgi:hypothetical protein
MNALPTALPTLASEYRIRRGVGHAAYKKLCELNVELRDNGRVAYWPSENEPGYFSAYRAQADDGAFSCGAESEDGMETPCASLELSRRVHEAYRFWRESALSLSAAKDQFDKAGAAFLEQMVEESDG